MDLRDSLEGIRVLESFSGRPDERGVMEELELALPEYDRGVYYQSGWWPGGGNRVYPHIMGNDELGEGGIFMLLELRSGRYLAVLPLCGDIAYAWLASSGSGITLKIGTHGRDPIDGDIPVCAWATADNPYAASYRCWQMATECVQIKGRMKMREAKAYPEPFEYLGWCSWMQYGTNIDEQNMLQAMKDIESSGVPVRYFLLDAGHIDAPSLTPNAKFPNGYAPLAKMRKADKIKWLGVWYSFMGDWHGTDAPGDLGPLSEHMYECNAGKLLPNPTPAAARAFYEHLFAPAANDGADFVKVDFLSDALPFYAGTPKKNPLGPLPNDNATASRDPLADTANMAREFQAAVEEQFGGLINCNWHNAVSIFNTQNSVVGRCSEDYQVGNLGMARDHLYHSYSAMPWLGQVAWGDHDMFHSNDPFAGRMMAVSKAMSGGPVYVSDAPAEFTPEFIAPLAYEDGRLLRPLAPAAPLPDDVFKEPGSGLYRVIAPLPNGAAAIVVYNLAGGTGDDEEELSTSITPEDYANASAMIQPWPGPWDLPGDGLLVYDWYSGQAARLDGEHEVTIKGFGDRLLQVSPIVNGWAVIGRTDKYLSAAAVEVVSCERDAVTLKLHESGPIAVWCSDGTPTADGLTFIEKGNCLHEAQMPVETRPVMLIIERH